MGDRAGEWKEGCERWFNYLSEEEGRGAGAPPPCVVQRRTPARLGRAPHLQTATVCDAPGGGVRTDSRPPSMWGRRLKVTVKLPSLMVGRWLRGRCADRYCGWSRHQTRRLRARARASR